MNEGDRETEKSFCKNWNSSRKQNKSTFRGWIQFCTGDDRRSVQKITFPAFVQKMSGAAWIQTEVKIGFKTGVSSFYDLDSKGETLLNKSPPEVLSNLGIQLLVFNGGICTQIHFCLYFPIWMDVPCLWSNFEAVRNCCSLLGGAVSSIRVSLLWGAVDVRWQVADGQSGNLMLHRGNLVGNPLARWQQYDVINMGKGLGVFYQLLLRRLC